ncbi:MAG: MoaD/ThiS family protein [Deltaproteobacteria bacterium]|nr:MAG: MoaD/ThiS family protein [Deltaproteobacteria bacterium]
MQVDVELLVPYKQIAKAQNVQVEIEGNTLENLLQSLIKLFPELENHLMDEEVPGALPFLLLINGKVVPVADPTEICLKPGDQVGFTRVVAGG